MDAALVYDGCGSVMTPKSMGEPLPDQCQGTPLEVLGEVASRICYDSLGLDENGKRRGRSSEQLHGHILDVKNHSVYEHCNFTVEFDTTGYGASFLLPFLNRKGVWLEFDEDVLQVTINFRTVLEWDRHTKRANNVRFFTENVGRVLWMHGRRLAPQIFTVPLETSPGLWESSGLIAQGSDTLNEDQACITLWLYGSRGFTHEQVRHRFAMSQRSTRYVDENESPYIMHPLVHKFLDDQTINSADRHLLDVYISRSIKADRETYKAAVTLLQDYCIRKLGITDKTAARKQARGAARGYLGNALASEMLFTAPVSGWKWILEQRKNRFADAEIREIYSPALAALKSSRYGHCFAEYETIPSPDGIGTVLR